VANQSKEDAGLKAFTELLKLPLTIDNILAADTDKLEEIIYPINFYKVIYTNFNIHISLFLNFFI
jgi:endonuclease III